MRVSRDALIGRISQLEPRVVLMIAGSGNGKTYLARQLLARATHPSYCDMRDVLDPQDADRIIGDAFYADGSPADLLVVDEASAFERIGWAPLDRLLRRLGDETRVMLLFRTPPRYDFSWFAAPHETLTLLREDLIFTRREVVELFAAAGCDEESAHLAFEAGTGWPVSTLVLLRLAREGRLAESLRDPTGVDFGDLHQYIKVRVIERLSREVVDALVAIAALGDAAPEELDALVGPGASEAIEIQREEYAPYITYENGRFGLTRFVGATVRAKYERGVRNVARNAAAWFLERGLYNRAAHAAVASGAWDTAVEALERIPDLPVDRQTRMLVRALPFDRVVGSPRLLIWLLSSAATRADPEGLLRGAREALARWDQGQNLLARYGFDLAFFLGATLTNATDEAIARERELVASGTPPGGELLAHYFLGERATLAAALGRLDDANALLDAAEPEFYPLQIMICEFNRLLYEGPAAELLAYGETLVARAKPLSDEGALRLARSYYAVATFFALDRETFSRAVSEAAAPVSKVPAARRANDGDFAPERGVHPLQMDVLCSIDAAYRSADLTVAAALLDDVIGAVEGTRRPFWRALVRIARAGAPGSDRKRLLDEALAIAQSAQAPRFLEDVRAIAQGKTASGPLENLQRLIAASPLLRGANKVRVSIVDGAVSRGNGALPVRAREFEILALLALSPAAISVEEICDAVWPQAEPEAALSALRMSVHRLRKQLGEAGAVERAPQGYRAGEMISCDIVEAERTIAACRRLTTLGAYERTRLRELFGIFAAPALSVSSRFSWYGQIETRIAGIRHSLGVVLGRDALANGDPSGAAELAEALLGVDAYDEPAVELLVRALDAAGERAEAVRRFRQYAERLKSDYGVETSVQLASLLETRKAG
ncbi:MAG TPA: BTAD domain-containing putative transcriptional regulator [Candidatus Acidoferrales bacterium]|nr:BTAD domain-containing putative transcriptional regulator [Candidatus Acidoferrales bacterium]